MHRIAAICVGSIVILSAACVSVAPGASDAPGTADPSSPPASASANASGEVTTAPSAAATATDATSPDASRTPKPRRTPKTPAPTATATSASGPNLVALEFSVRETELLAGHEYRGTFKVRNDGPSAIETFQIDFGYDAGGVGGGSGSTDVSVGLEPGATVAAQIFIYSDVGGDVRFTARADPADEIDETNEDDNSAAFEMHVVGLPDLAFAANGLSVTVDGDTMTSSLTLINSGEQRVERSFGIRYTRINQDSDTEVVSEMVTVSLAVGQLYTHEFSTYVEPGRHYTYEAILDIDGDISEAAEDNNVATITFDS